MATARSEQVNLDVTPYYHCMSRCVRRAFLCGKDSYSGQDYEHRKPWVRDRLRFLAGLFAIDVCAYAVMSNHLHVVLHVDEERGKTFSDTDVVSRYTTLYPMTKAAWQATLPAHERQALLTLWRARLCDISWMMRALNEYIARKANKEEKIRGRFWEGRFKSQAILDEEGLVTCMAYVDLNPVRAELASSLDGSDFTSIQERLRDLAKKREQRRKGSAPKTLAPFTDQERGGQSIRAVPMDFCDYVELLEWTGRAMTKGKRGMISGPPAVLSARGISAEGWLHALGEHRLGTASFLGSAASLDALAQAKNKAWLRGIGLARGMAA